MIRNRSIWALLLLLIAVGCGDVVEPSDTGAFTITVSPSPAMVVEGDDLQMEATIRDAAGDLVTGRQVLWTVEHEGFVSVSAGGTLTGLRAGETRVAANSRGQSAITVVQVRPRPVAAVHITPDSARIAVGETASLQAVLRDAAGGELADRTVEWTSKSPEIAVSVGGGVFRGIRPGVAEVTASSEGRTATARIRVVAGAPARIVIIGEQERRGVVGTTLPDPLTVQVQDASGNPVAGVRVEWKPQRDRDGSVSPSTAQTDNNGHASTRWTLGFHPGEQRVNAEVVGAGVVTFTARPSAGAVSSIAVRPSSVELTALGEATALQSTATDEYGNPLPNATLTWTSLSPTVATVSGSGRVEAKANGTTRIVVTSGGRADTATVRVRQVAASVAITPASEVLRIGRQLQFTATARDRNGNTVANPSFSWSSSRPAVAEINSSGRVTGRTIGSTAIRVEVNGQSATASVAVQQVSVARIVVSPGDASLAAGSSLQLEARINDADGNRLTDRQVSWTSSSPAVATVDGSGKVTAVRPGVTTVTATSEGQSGTARISVNRGRGS